MKALKALWKLVGDDRLNLLLAGMCLGPLVKALSLGDYWDAAMTFAVAASLGGFAWRDLGRAVRS